MPSVDVLASSHVAAIERELAAARRTVAPQRARVRPVRRARALAYAGVLAAFVVMPSMALAGVLPDAVQRAASRIAANVGVSVPLPDSGSDVAREQVKDVTRGPDANGDHAKGPGLGLGDETRSTARPASRSPARSAATASAKYRLARTRARRNRLASRRRRASPWRRLRPRSARWRRSSRRRSRHLRPRSRRHRLHPPAAPRVAAIPAAASRPATDVARPTCLTGSEPEQLVSCCCSSITTAPHRSRTRER